MMAGDEGGSLEQRRKVLQDELAKQRELVSLRLTPPRIDAPNAEPRPAMPGISAAYPRSITMRLAKQHPALAVGLVALGVTLLLRGRREDLNSILSMAKSLDSLFTI